MKSEAEEQGNGAAILIAEDSRTQAEQLGFLLEQHGYHVTIAANGKLALQAAQAQKPALVISDIVMPEMDGYELCKAIKSGEKLNNVPVILVTTLSDSQDVLRGLECGADNFILKPYDEHYLLNRVQFALLNSEMRQTDQSGMGVEIFFKGKKHFIASGRLQILNLLLSTYDAAIQRNEDLRRAKDELQEVNIALGEANSRLEQARHEADQANNAKSSFLAAMSHEIRTPMNGVIGMVDVLHQTSLKGYQVEMVDLIRESAYSLLSIIDDILDFSKIEADRLEIEHAPMSVADVVEKACGMLNRLTDKACGELTMFTDPAIPEEVVGDALRLRQILVNLVNNAIKFSCRQGQPGRVSVRAILAGNDPTGPDPEQVVVEIRIADNGIGMDQKTLSGLFTPFSQADVSTTRRFGGTGLGLTISQHLAELMGGDITVRSEPDQGSTFTVRLPFALNTGRDSSLHAELAGIKPDPPVAGLSCLVVGNAEGLADDLAAYLAHDGATVERAADMDAARTSTRPLPPGKLPPEKWIWIVETAGVPPSQDELRAIAGARPKDGICFVVIGRGRRREPRVVADNVVSVDGNALSRRAFLKAVAVAAGRALEEKHVPLPGRNEAEFMPPSREDAQRHGRLILVAEDNETNQKVILRQLALLGFAADIAGNGRMALQRWQSGDYALLLSDLHMPDMDGYELTTAIRAAENGSAIKNGSGRVPIIALTANVLKGEAERCRSTGMDDYLGKPVQLSDLQAMLKKWLPIADESASHRQGERSSPPPLQDEANSEGQSSPPLQGEGRVQADAIASPVDVNVLRALVGNDDAVVHKLLQDFRINAAEIATKLRIASMAGQAKAAGDAAHKLKSSARAMGALSLGDLCAEIEQAGMDNDTKALAALLPGFEQELAKVDLYLSGMSLGDE